MVLALRIVGWLAVVAGVLNLLSVMSSLTYETTGLGALATWINVGGFILPGMLCVGVAEILTRLPKHTAD